MACLVKDQYSPYPCRRCLQSRERILPILHDSIISNLVYLKKHLTNCVQLEPFYQGVLDLVNHQIAQQEPELAKGFRYVERFLKLSFRCASGDMQTCSWEAVKFFAEWQLDRIGKRLPFFCQGALVGPGLQKIDFSFGLSTTMSGGLGDGDWND